jgi:transcriptional regulator of acetoin/glycerol metabolism
VLDRARLYADDGVVRVEHLPQELGSDLGRDLAKRLEQAPRPTSGVKPIADEAALRAQAHGWQGTRKALAEHLGWSERTLYRRLKALGLA